MIDLVVQVNPMAHRSDEDNENRLGASFSSVCRPAWMVDCNNEEGQRGHGIDQKVPDAPSVDGCKAEIENEVRASGCHSVNRE